jgi:methionyl aminopeptidase
MDREAYMITLKSEAEIAKMKQAGELLASCHREIRRLIAPGISTLEIDRFVEDFLKKHGATPEQKGYHGYPFATCAAVNDVICHGFPGKKPLADGDIVGIDMVVNLDGWLADSAWSYAVGNINDEARKLLDITKQLLYKGIEKAVAGNRVGDISNIIQTLAETNGYSVVRDFTGHGIGRFMHEDPQIPHFGPAGRGHKLREGMVFTIEPMINAGGHGLTIDSLNGWTARTRDGSLSAQYEHTIAITENGPLILTEQD